MKTISPNQITQHNLSISFVLVSLFLLVVLALEMFKPPIAKESNAQQNVFSAHRAMPHVQQIAAKPHPIGSPENNQVRQYILQQLQILGWHPQVQTAQAFAHYKRSNKTGLVHNIVAKKQGIANDRQKRKALMLTAHYDSVPQGPGAGDDAASVAAILETLRAMNLRAPLQNDVIVLITDGEEAGLLGAEAFVAEHPWAKDIGLVLNFEYRGNSGPMFMFETSVGNGRMIEGLAKAVEQPAASSLNYEIYKLLSNDTDLSVMKRANIAGMNFAAIDGHQHYHTPIDTPERLNINTMQHQGDIMLSLVQFFGQQNLQDLQSGDHVYFDLLGIKLVHYPYSVVMPLTIALTFSLLAIVVIGVRQYQWRPARILLGIFSYTLMIAVIAVASQYAWKGVKLIHPQYSLMLQGEPYNSHWYLFMFVALALAAYLSLQRGIRKWITTAELQISCCVVWMLLLALVSVYLPGASFLFLWPLLFTCIAICLEMKFTLKTNRPRTVLFLIAAVPGILLFTPVLKGIFIALTPNLIFVFVIVLVLLLGLLSTLLAYVEKQLLLISLFTGFVFLIAGSLTSDFNEQHPRPTHLMYLHDADSNKNYWISQTDQLDEWSKQYFTPKLQREILPDFWRLGTATSWLSSAPDLGVKAIQVSVLQDESTVKERIVELEIKSLRHAQIIQIEVIGAIVNQALIGDHTIKNNLKFSGGNANWQLNATGIHDDGLKIKIKLHATKQFTMHFKDVSYGIPDNPLPKKPSDFMMQPGTANSVQTVRTVQFN